MAALAFAKLLLGAQAATGVASEVVSEGGCPEARDVERRFAQMTGSSAAAAGLRATLDQAAPGLLRLRWSTARDVTVTEKMLRVPADCDARAEIVAVALAAEQSAVDSSIPEIDPLRPNVRAGSPSSPWRLALAPYLQMDARGTVPGGLVDVEWAPRDGAPLAIAFVAGSPLWRREPLENASSRWLRPFLALGIRQRIRGATATVELTQQALLVATIAEGEGFVRDDRATAASVGGAVSVAFARRIGRAELWGATRLHAHVRRQRLASDEGANTVELPRMELLLAIGVGWHP